MERALPIEPINIPKSINPPKTYQPKLVKGTNLVEKVSKKVC